MATEITYNYQDSWKVMPGTKLRLLLGDQALLKVKPLVLCIQVYQPRKAYSESSYISCISYIYQIPQVNTTKTYLQF